VRRGAAEYPRWKALLYDDLEARYPVWDHALLLLGGSYDSGYSADVWIPGYRIGFHVSLLGPYYAVHRIGAPGEEEVAIDLARAIEAAYPGYEPIPPEIGEEIVPDVCPFGRATIYRCLLSLWWDESSVPHDDQKSPDYVVPLDDADPEEEAPATGPERIIVKVKDTRP